jgi:hypothetical protein
MKQIQIKIVKRSWRADPVDAPTVSSTITKTWFKEE